MIDIIALICRRGFFIASGRKDEDINNAPLSQATGHWANPQRRIHSQIRKTKKIGLKTCFYSSWLELKYIDRNRRGRQILHNLVANYDPQAAITEMRRPGAKSMESMALAGAGLQMLT